MRFSFHSSAEQKSTEIEFWRRLVTQPRGRFPSAPFFHRNNLQSVAFRVEEIVSAAQLNVIRSQPGIDYETQLCAHCCRLQMGQDMRKSKVQNTADVPVSRKLSVGRFTVGTFFLRTSPSDADVAVVFVVL